MSKESRVQSAEVPRSAFLTKDGRVITIPPDSPFSKRQRARQDEMTARALTMIFGFSRPTAERAVVDRLSEFPKSLHDVERSFDPSVRAAYIAEVDPTALHEDAYIKKIIVYDTKVRPVFERRAQCDLERIIKTHEKSQL